MAQVPLLGRVVAAEVADGEVIEGYRAEEALNSHTGSSCQQACSEGGREGSIGGGVESEEWTCVVEEAPFQEEVDQRVERVPDEEEAVAARGRGREGLE